jgi:hypothetical protein
MGFISHFKESQPLCLETMGNQEPPYFSINNVTGLRSTPPEQAITESSSLNKTEVKRTEKLEDPREEADCG